MPLFIRDDEVDRLAEELRRLSHARTKTEAVRDALRHRLAEMRGAVPLSRRLEHAKALADALGEGDPTFDMKAYTDALWDDA